MADDVQGVIAAERGPPENIATDEYSRWFGGKTIDAAHELRILHALMTELEDSGALMRLLIFRSTNKDNHDILI